MTGPLLSCERVSVRRGARVVLSDISFSLDAGEFVALIGPNGAGKSTLLEAVSGSVAPVTGRIRLGHDPIERLPLTERARRLAFVGREHSSGLALSVSSVVSLGRIPYQQDRVARALDEAAIEEALRETDCTKLRNRPLFSLSDGERQRVYFARALAQKAAVLLLDEATAHLDLAHRERSFTRARRFASEGGAVLAVAHDLDLALRHASRIVVLHQGRIVADDVPTEALSPALLRDVFEVDAKISLLPQGNSLLILGALS